LTALVEGEGNVRAQDFDDLVAHPHDRIQCERGLLVDDGNFMAAYFAKLRAFELYQVPSPKENRAGQVCRPRQELQKSQGHRSLSAAGPSFDAQYFPGADFEI